MKPSQPAATSVLRSCDTDTVKTEIAPDGTRKRVLRYESLGEVPRKQASEVLDQPITAAGNKLPTRSRVTFRGVASDGEVSVLPMYKHSTPNASTLHAEEAPVAAVRRDGDL